MKMRFISFLLIAVIIIVVVLRLIFWPNKGDAQSTTSAMATSGTQTAVFAGGCFWCMQSDFDKEKGVVKTVVGYAGGLKSTANYSDVSAGGTQHTEAIEITYNPNIVSYKALVNYFYHHIDPFNGQGQFCDTGSQYRPVIYFKTADESKIAEALNDKLEKQLGKPAQPAKFKVEIIPYSAFFPAEIYHQDYYKKNPLRYKYYRWGCGRDQRVKVVWGSS